MKKVLCILCMVWLTAAQAQQEKSLGAPAPEQQIGANKKTGSSGLGQTLSRGQKREKAGKSDAMNSARPMAFQGAEERISLAIWRELMGAKFHEERVQLMKSMLNCQVMVSRIFVE